MKNPNNSNRVLYEYLKQQYPGKDIKPSYLRQEILLKNGQGQYEFKFVESEDVLPLKSLKKINTFVAYSIGIFLLKDNLAKPGTAILQTYANDIVFPNDGVASTDFQTENLESIYSGELITSVGTNQVSQPMDLLRFRNVNQTQKSAVNNDTQSDGLTDGFFDLDPFMVIPGKEANKFTINFPANVDVKIQCADLAKPHKLVLMHRGFNILGTE